MLFKFNSNCVVWWAHTQIIEHVIHYVVNIDTHDYIYNWNRIMSNAYKILQLLNNVANVKPQQRTNLVTLHFTYPHAALANSWRSKHPQTLRSQIHKVHSYYIYSQRNETTPFVSATSALVNNNKTSKVHLSFHFECPEPEPVKQPCCGATAAATTMQHNLPL